MRATMFRSLSAAVCGLLVIVLVSSALAQDGPRGRRGRGPGMGGPGMGGPGMGGPMRGGMGGGMGMAMLLQIEKVQKEIQLTEDQKAELKKLADATMEEGRKAMEEGRKATEGMDRDEARKWWEDNREKFQKEMGERMKKATEQVNQILKPEQVARLKQIEMQMANVQVLRRPEVQQQLALTDDQKGQLQKIEEKMRGEMQKAWPQRGGGDEAERPSREEWRKTMEEMRQKMEKMREEVEKKCMAVLTPEQKKKLGEMMGEPFELDRSAFRRGGMGPFGPGGGRRGEGGRDGERRGRRDRRGEENRSEQI